MDGEEFALYYGHEHSGHQGAGRLDYEPSWVRETLCFDAAMGKVHFETREGCPHVCARVGSCASGSLDGRVLSAALGVGAALRRALPAELDGAVESAAFARSTVDPQTATYQFCQLSGKRYGEPDAVVLSSGGIVRLVERFEDSLALFGGNPDAGIANAKV